MGREEVAVHLPSQLHASWREQLLSTGAPDERTRPRLGADGDSVFGVFVVPVAVPDEDRVFYQEVDVLLTRDQLVTVRKAPPGEPLFDSEPARAACRAGESVGMVAAHLADSIADRYLDLVDALHVEVEELEDGVSQWPAERVRDRLSQLRHELLRIRQTLAPMRDAIRRVVDNRVELAGAEELFPRDVELHFGDAYDKLVRCGEGLDLCRDLFAGVRDDHQAKVANEQNEVMKRLTLIASLLLLPTLIVGLYGQNFERIPGKHWGSGFWFSIGVIAGVTIAQLLIFRWRRWI